MASADICITVCPPQAGASLCSAFVHGSEQIDFLSLWPLYACRTLMPMTPAGWRRCHCFLLNVFNIATLINALERRQSIAPVFPIQKWFIHLVQRRVRSRKKTQNLKLSKFFHYIFKLKKKKKNNTAIALFCKLTWAQPRSSLRLYARFSRELNVSYL